MSKHYYAGITKSNIVIVVSVPFETYNNMTQTQQDDHRVASLKIGGDVSQMFAEAWGIQIARQLNDLVDIDAKFDGSD